MPPRELPHVEVTGDAEREVLPDEVVVRVEIRTPTTRTPSEALAEGVARRGRVRPVLEAVEGARVADARVTTAAIHRNVKRSDPYGGTTTETEIAGHQGTCSLTARAGADSAAALLAAVGSHPDVFRAVPSFRVGRELARATQRELEQDAVRDALARAAALALAAGMRAGVVLRIAEPGSGDADDHGPLFVERAYSMSASIDPDDIGELVPEEVTLSARVVVTVALEPAG